MKRIAFISQPEYFRVMYEDLLGMEDCEVREFPMKFDSPESDFNGLLEFQPDYAFFFRGEFFPENLLKKITGKKIALSSEPFPRKIKGRWQYTKDSVKRYLNFRSIRNKKFDYVFHYDAASLELFKKDGLNVAGEFVLPVSTEIYQPLNLEKKWDIFFIGRSTPYREKYFTSLKHKFNFLHIAHGIWGPELVKYYNQAKICLNVHAENEISWEPRMQQMLAAGALVVSEPISPNKYLKPARDYAEAGTPQEMYQKVEHYLSDEGRGKAIVESGLANVRRNFNAKRNFLALISKIDSGEHTKFSGQLRKKIFLLDWAEGLINFKRKIVK